MSSLTIPGFGSLKLKHLVCDFNGTLATDGRLLPGVAERLTALARKYQIHVLTADTHGGVARELGVLPVLLTVIKADDQAEAKRDYIATLDVDRVVAIGNGRNDRAMLRAAALGVAVIQREGAAAGIFNSADLVVVDVLDALDLLRFPKRLIATLRS